MSTFICVCLWLGAPLFVGVSDPYQPGELVEGGGSVEGGDVCLIWYYEPWSTVSTGHHLHSLSQQCPQLAGIQLHTGTVLKKLYNDSIRPNPNTTPYP